MDDSDKQFKPKKNNNWTLKEEAILEQLYSNHSNHHISEVLEKTKNSIDQKASTLGLKKSSTHRKKINRQNNQRKRQAWTAKDVQYLLDNYSSKSYSKIADHISRTESAVSQKARQLDIKKYQK